MTGICIVGLGGYAAKHAAALRAAKDVRLFCASRAPQKAVVFGRLNGAQALAGFEAACDDPGVRGVVLCGPHESHVPDALTALRAGKAVLLEKPLARSVSEGRLLAGPASKGLLMLAENYAFLPHLPVLRRLLPRIGRLRSVSVVYSRSYRPTGWRRSAERMGGGILIDLGVHYLRLLRMLFGPLRRVRARYALHDASMEGESEILAEFSTGGDVRGAFLASWSRETAGTVSSLTAGGSRGVLTAPLLEPRVLLSSAGRSRSYPVPWDDPNGQKGLAREFVRCLRTGRRPLVGAAEGLEDLAFVEAAYRSLRSRPTG